MRKIVLFILFCFAFTCVHAETLLLRTGTRVKGTIVLQNEVVVIIKDAEGARFQYPMTDVLEVLKEDEIEPVAEEHEARQEEQEIKTAKKVSALLELSGGAAINPNDAVGGVGSVDLIIGSHHIGSKHILIGGGLGYHALFIGGETFNFLPVQVALRMPFIEAKHAPVFGASVGYGVALSKNYIGGIYAGVDFGYKYQINPKTALAISLFVQFQQAKINATQIIEGEEFVSKVGRNFISPGLKLSLYF